MSAVFHVNAEWKVSPEIIKIADRPTSFVHYAAFGGFTHPADRGEAGLVEESVVGEVDEKLRTGMDTDSTHRKSSANQIIIIIIIGDWVKMSCMCESRRKQRRVLVVPYLPLNKKPAAHASTFRRPGVRRFS